MKNKLKNNTRFLMLKTWLLKRYQIFFYIDKTNKMVVAIQIRLIYNFRDNNKDVEHQLKKNLVILKDINVDNRV